MADEHPSTDDNSTDDNAPQTPLAPDDRGVSTDDTTVSLSEAAKRLDVSERTVLRRIQKGVLPAYKIDTLHGPAWRITLDSAPLDNASPDSAPGAAPVTPAQSVSTDDTSPAAPEFVKVLEMLEAERARNDHLQHENSQLYGQVGFLQAKLQDAEHKIALLEAPKDDPSVDAVQAKIPWWKRLWGG